MSKTLQFRFGFEQFITSLEFRLIAYFGEFSIGHRSCRIKYDGRARENTQRRAKRQSLLNKMNQIILYNIGGSAPSYY